MAGHNFPITFPTPTNTTQVTLVVIIAIPFALEILISLLGIVLSKDDWKVVSLYAGAMILVSLFLLYFILSKAQLGWKLLKTEVMEATFVRVINTDVTIYIDGMKSYTWKIECKAQDPKTNKELTFTSQPFNGDELYYNSDKIKVMVFGNNPIQPYAIDFAPITNKKKPGGIPLVTAALIDETESKGVEVNHQSLPSPKHKVHFYKSENDKKHTNNWNYFSDILAFWLIMWIIAGFILYTFVSFMIKIIF